MLQAKEEACAASIRSYRLRVWVMTCRPGNESWRVIVQSTKETSCGVLLAGSAYDHETGMAGGCEMEFKGGAADS